MKKLAILLATVCFFVGATACGKKPQENDGKDVLRIFMIEGNYLEGTKKDSVWKKIEEETNVSMRFEGAVNNGDYYTRLNPMLNSGKDMPDIFFSCPDATDYAYWKWANQKTGILSLKTNNPHGSCAYKTKDLVDHQSVLIEFENGITATLNMTGGASRAGRELHIVCERGEIEGFLESNEFKVRKFNADKAMYDEETVFVTEDVSGAHSGGDLRLAADFVARVSGETPSVSCTSIEDSVEGHLIAIAAERSRKEGRTVFFDNNPKGD